MTALTQHRRNPKNLLASLQLAGQFSMLMVIVLRQRFSFRRRPGVRLRSKSAVYENPNVGEIWTERDLDYGKMRLAVLAPGAEARETDGVIAARRFWVPGIVTNRGGQGLHLERSTLFRSGGVRILKGCILASITGNRITVRERVSYRGLDIAAGSRVVAVWSSWQIHGLDTVEQMQLRARQS